MTNPTSYTDEQVLSFVSICDAMGEPETPDMLRSLLADRQRLQADVEVFRRDAERYRWLRNKSCCAPIPSPQVELPYSTFWEDGSQLLFFGELDKAIDDALATPNETKEAKS